MLCISFTVKDCKDLKVALDSCINDVNFTYTEVEMTVGHRIFSKQECLTSGQFWFWSDTMSSCHVLNCQKILCAHS